MTKAVILIPTSAEANLVAALDAAKTTSAVRIQCSRRCKSSSSINRK